MSRYTFSTTTLADNSLKWIYIEYLDVPSINDTREVQQITHKPSWMDPLIRYLIEGILRDNP